MLGFAVRWIIKEKKTTFDFLSFGDFRIAEEEYGPY